MKKKLLFAICALVLLVCSCNVENKQSKTYYTYFDTVCTITSYSTQSEKEFEQVCSKVDALLSSLNRELDIYHEYAALNNLCTLNKNAGSYIELPQSLVDFLHFCVDMYTLTDGYTDVSMGSVLKLWHTARTETGVLPTDSELAAAIEHCGIDLLEFDGNKVRISDPLASIDPGAIAKGWAAEQVYELLVSLGCSSYIIDLGGNVRIVGSKLNGNDFTVGIKNPSLDGTLSAKLNLSDTSCVTSGDYERFFIVDGKSYCHIINKDTLYPSEKFASVTVITQNSAKADALSTALFCMDYEQGLALINSLDDVRAVWILKDGTCLFSF